MSPGLRRFLIFLVIALGPSSAAYASRDGDVIKVYVTVGDPRELIREFNFAMAPHSIQLAEVESPLGADVTISFQEENLPDAYGIAYPWRGHIRISSDADGARLLKVVIHELLHCAGEGHDTEPDSVMNARSWSWTLRESQIRDLRRLSGITMPERQIAQFRSSLWIL